jgi:hypothetical protein
VRVVRSKGRGSGRFRARQAERILSGDEPRDHVSAFLTAMIQDLRDVSRAEIPSSVAARHLLRMRLAREMSAAGPEPFLEEEEPVLPPPRPRERRPTVAALGVAAAMVVMIGIAASITLPRAAGTRAGGVVRSHVPPVVETGPGGLDRFIPDDHQSAEVRGCGITRLTALAVSLTSEVAPVLPQWPPLCPSSVRDVNPQSVKTARGPAAGQPPATVVTGAISAGAIDGSSSMIRSGAGPGGPRGSGGGSGSGENRAGGGTGNTTDPGPNATGHSKGRDNGGGHGGDDGLRASGYVEKGSGKKAER